MTLWSLRSKSHKIKYKIYQNGNELDDFEKDFERF